MGIPTFTDNIPSSGQSLGQTRQAINDNFGNYYGVMSVNHYAPDDANKGKHKFLQMPEQASAPLTAVNELALYSKDVSGNSRMFLRQENNGAEIQISGVTPSISGNKGYTFLPGGFLMQWGRVTINSNSLSWPVIYPITFDLPAYSVMANASQDRTIYISNNTLSTGMTISINTNMTNGQTIYWMAIGLKA